MEKTLERNRYQLVIAICAVTDVIENAKCIEVMPLIRNLLFQNFNPTINVSSPKMYLKT